MANEKGYGFGEEEGQDAEQGVAPRARNRTVMLTPEMTGAVRAKIGQAAATNPVQPQRQVPATNFGSPAAPSQTYGNPYEGRGGNYSSPAGQMAAAFDSGMGNAPAPQVSHAPPYAAPTSAPAYTQQHVSTPPVHTHHHDAVKLTPIQEEEAVAATPIANTVWTKMTPIVGFLVSYDEEKLGEVFYLRSGRLVVTSDLKAAGGSYMYVDHPSVSQGHAILRITAQGEIQVLDQLSEFGTKIKRCGTDEVVELAGDKGQLEHGDVLIVGERSFSVGLLVRDLDV